MSGGKGGSSSSAAEIPTWISDPAKRNIARAEQVQQIGYQPYYGVDVAGFNPTQKAAMQMNIDTAKAFGMAPAQGLKPLAGMPPAQTVGGVTGYTSSGLFEDAIAAANKANPQQRKIYGSLFNKDTGYKA